MSTPDNPPLSRRAARQAELSTRDAALEAFAQPVTQRPRGGTPVSVPSSAPTDVAYRTQVRPRVPHYDAAPTSHTVIPEGSADTSPGVVPLVASTPVGPPATAPLVEPPMAPPAGPGSDHVRRRDFRPPTEQQSPLESAALPASTFDTSLEYHTQLTPPPDAHSAALATDTATGVPPMLHVLAPLVSMPESALEQTLSRREMRVLREQAGLAPEQSTFPEPSAFPEQSVSLADHEPVAATLAEPVPLAEPSAEFDASSSSAPTRSHWSVGIHDTGDPFENTFSREVGLTASLSHTNALVLPEMPTGSIGGPVAGTGEIIITGMIDIPRAVSSTGTMPKVHESPDIDDLFDPGDLAAAPADAAPVSALKAISSHAAAHVLISTGKRPSSNTVTTVLVASTVVMAVVAIGLFVLAAVNGLF